MAQLRCNGCAIDGRGTKETLCWRWRGPARVTLWTYVHLEPSLHVILLSLLQMLPPSARLTNAAETIPVKALHSSLNKVKHPINVVRWTPEGRRLLTGSTSGEFTLWNGMGFNFETIMQVRTVGTPRDFVEILRIL